jgi:hypothetical protein
LLGLFRWLRRPRTPVQRERRRIEAPPFPPLEWDDFQWSGEADLPGLAGLQDRQGPYTGLSSESPSDGRFALYVAADEEDPRPPTGAQARAFQYLQDEGARVREVFLEAVFQAYREWQERKAWPDMPRVERAEQMTALVGIGNVYVLATERDGCAYVGFECGCDWDEEHGCGVLTHRDRVIAVDDAETAWNDGLAEEDAGLHPPGP